MRNKKTRPVEIDEIINALDVLTRMSDSCFFSPEIALKVEEIIMHLETEVDAAKLGDDE